MSMLTDLRAATPVGEEEEPPWNAFKRTMPLLVPGFKLSKMEVFSGGRVGARGKSPMQGKGNYYFVMVLDAIGTGRADGTRPVRLGVSSYRDEADAMIYDKPFGAYLEPQPGVVAVWLAGVLLTESPFSSRRVPLPDPLAE